MCEVQNDCLKIFEYHKSVQTDDCTDVFALDDLDYDENDKIIIPTKYRSAYNLHLPMNPEKNQNEELNGTTVFIEKRKEYDNQPENEAQLCAVVIKETLHSSLELSSPGDQMEIVQIDEVINDNAPSDSIPVTQSCNFDKYEKPQGVQNEEINSEPITISTPNPSGENKIVAKDMLIKEPNIDDNIEEKHLNQIELSRSATMHKLIIFMMILMIAALFIFKHETPQVFIYHHWDFYNPPNS